MTPRQRQLHADARAWIERNIGVFEALVGQCTMRVMGRRKFSIRELCEAMRWEEGGGIDKGGQSYAIPNALSRYIGIEIMRRHPETERWMTTSLPKEPAEPMTILGNDGDYGARIVEGQKGEKATTPSQSEAPQADAREACLAMAAWARQALTGEPQNLVWWVALEADLGQGDVASEPDSYSDGRFVELIERLKGKLGEPAEGTTELRIVVECSARPSPQRTQPIEVDGIGEQHVQMGRLSANPPPVGRWLVQGDAELESCQPPIPASYFMDGIPF